MSGGIPERLLLEEDVETTRKRVGGERAIASGRPAIWIAGQSDAVTRGSELWRRFGFWLRNMSDGAEPQRD